MVRSIKTSTRPLYIGYFVDKDQKRFITHIFYGNLFSHSTHGVISFNYHMWKHCCRTTTTTTKKVEPMNHINIMCANYYSTHNLFGTTRCIVLKLMFDPVSPCNKNNNNLSFVTIIFFPCLPNNKCNSNFNFHMTNDNLRQYLRYWVDFLSMFTHRRKKKINIKRKKQGKQTHTQLGRQVFFS